MNADDIRFIDLFGGIGGFRLGLENASDKFECVDYIEYDKYAVKSYNEIFEEEHEPRDVTQLATEQIPEHDLICAGFPCQAFSVAGNRKGTDEARGKLFREIVRIAKAHRPEMLLLENVKGLLSQKAVTDGESVEGTKGHAFTEILQALHELGYCLEWRVLNSKNWGVPQNRERVFIVGHLGGEPRQKVFPLKRENREDTGENGREINSVGNVNPSGRGMNGEVYEASEKTVMPTVSTNKGEGQKILKFGEYLDYGSVGNVLDPRGICSALAMSQGANRAPEIIQNHRNREIREHGDESPTLNKKQGGGQLPMVLNPEMHSTDAVHHPEGISSTVRAKAGGKTRGLGVLEQPQILNHQFRPESRPSIENGQSGGSGLLYNSDYCYALSSSPHFLVDDSYLAMEGELREYSKIAPSQRSERQGLKVVEPCLTPSRVEKRQNGRRFKESNEPMFTLTGQDIHGVKQEKRIRKLTPLECWRLQGFPDWAFLKAEQVNSDTQLYKQAGNSVTVNVIEGLAKGIVENLESKDFFEKQEN